MSSSTPGNPDFCLPMAGAWAQWQEGNNKEFWIIYDKDQKEIGKLSSKLNEREVMQAIRLAREFELEAFNTGIEFGKQTARKGSQANIDAIQATCEALKAENSRLAEQLLLHISGEVE